MLYNFFVRNKFISIYLPLIIYWLILFAATTLPAQAVPKTGISDKIEHFLGYFFLTILLSNLLYFQNRKGKIKRFPITASLIIVASYGMVDELHQYFIPGRFCDINDWIADVIGAVVAGLIYFLIKKYFQHVKNKQRVNLEN